jgi:SAM-dependent methyltransferase
VSDPHGLYYDPVAEDYERGRIGWPTEALDGVEGDVVLDLAAGTGKLTRLLAGRFPRVIAVEPLAGMRAVLERLVPAAGSLPGSAEAIPLGDASVDAVFVAEAFHWFDHAAAAREIARVLRPGGTLRLLFHDWDAYEPPIGEAAEAALAAVEARTGAAGGGKVRSGGWKRGFDGAPFTALEERHVAHEHVCDREGVIANYASISSAAALPEVERRALKDELRRTIADVEYRLAITTLVYDARRL